MTRKFHLHVQSKKTLNLKLEPRFYTVGSGPHFDLSVDSPSGGQLFSLLVQDDSVEVIPLESPLQLNGLKLKSSGKLKNLDRLSWEGGAAVLVEQSAPESTQNTPDMPNPMEILESILQSLEHRVEFPLALQRLMDFIMTVSQAQNCALLWENPEGAWELVAKRVSNSSIDLSTKTLLSQTILREALRNQDLVYVESLVGHTWAKALSVIENHLYSVAVVPLMVGRQVRGALFLSTQEAGRSLRKDGLENLRTIASMTTLLVMATKQVAQLRSQKPSSSQTQEGIGRLLGMSPEISQLRQRIKKLAPTPLPIYVKGPSGSGKELVARALHAESERHRGPFVALNCAAIPEALFESTLFGHLKGAFTGATHNRVGKFEQAHRGTLFLDEIADLPLDLQAKLLRVLQESVIEPVGSHQVKPVDVRVVCATHQDLKALVQAKNFREDLYYRLASTVLEVPALAERKADIVPLAQHFLVETQTQKTFSPAALDQLERYSWPGNIRQLKLCVERAAYLAEGIEITPADLDLSPEQQDFSENPSQESLSLDVSLRTAQRQFTKQFIEKVLQQSSSRTEAASRLGVSERTLYRLIEESAT